jgi:hypothetical protein
MPYEIEGVELIETIPVYGSSTLGMIFMLGILAAVILVIVGYYADSDILPMIAFPLAIICLIGVILCAIFDNEIVDYTYVVSIDSDIVNLEELYDKYTVTSVDGLTYNLRFIGGN